MYCCSAGRSIREFDSRFLLLIRASLQAKKEIASQLSNVAGCLTLFFGSKLIMLSRELTVCTQYKLDSLLIVVWKN